MAQYQIEAYGIVKSRPTLDLAQLFKAKEFGGEGGGDISHVLLNERGHGPRMKYGKLWLHQNDFHRSSIFVLVQSVTRGLRCALL